MIQKRERYYTRERNDKEKVYVTSRSMATAFTNSQKKIYNKNKTIPYTNYKLYDLVVRTQNCIDQEQMFANGETGTIWEYDQTANTVTIMYDSGQKQVISYQELIKSDYKQDTKKLFMYREPLFPIQTITIFIR